MGGVEDEKEEEAKDEVYMNKEKEIGRGSGWKWRGEKKTLIGKKKCVKAWGARHLDPFPVLFRLR
jgi:hypothetical protein